MKDYHQLFLYPSGNFNLLYFYINNKNKRSPRCFFAHGKSYKCVTADPQCRDCHASARQHYRRDFSERRLFRLARTDCRLVDAPTVMSRPGGRHSYSVSFTSSFGKTLPHVVPRCFSSTTGKAIATISSPWTPAGGGYPDCVLFNTIAFAIARMRLQSYRQIILEIALVEENINKCRLDFVKIMAFKHRIKLTHKISTLTLT